MKFSFSSKLSRLCITHLLKNIELRYSQWTLASSYTVDDLNWRCDWLSDTNNLSSDDVSTHKNAACLCFIYHCKHQDTIISVERSRNKDLHPHLRAYAKNHANKQNPGYYTDQRTVVIRRDDCLGDWCCHPVELSVWERKQTWTSHTAESMQENYLPIGRYERKSCWKTSKLYLYSSYFGNMYDVCLFRDSGALSRILIIESHSENGILKWMWYNTCATHHMQFDLHPMYTRCTLGNS